MQSNSIEAAVAKALPCLCDEIDDIALCPHHYWPAVLALVTEAVAAERAKCCADACGWCSGSFGALTYSRTPKFIDGEWRHMAQGYPPRLCSAGGIRKRGEAQG